MKRLILVVVAVGILALVLAGTAFAQGTLPGAQPGIHTPGTGLMQPGTGYGMRGMNGGMGTMRGGMPAWAGQPDAVETLLGMTDAEIQAERLAGKSLAQIAADKGKSKETLVSTILSAKKTILDQQVSAGRLTEAQAGAMYANMQQQVTVMVDRTDVGPGCSLVAGQTTGATTGRLGGRWTR